MTEIKVLKTGTQTTIQDRGRYGFQSYGVSPSGAMDSYAHRIANLLVGNNLFEAVFEICLSGCELEFSDDCVIALTGANLSPTLNGLSLPMWRTHFIQKHSRLSFGRIITGCRSYLAAAGGLDLPTFLNSQSYYERADIGQKLKNGALIEIKKPKAPLNSLIGRLIPPKHIPLYKSNINIRVIMGPQDDYFTEQGIKTFLSSKYTLTKDCDRMGYRLEGKKIEFAGASEIISDSLTLGSIQIPGNGKPIIMMADRQTTGGYPKIANVITADIPLLAQAKPGDSIEFTSVSVREAQSVLKIIRY